MPKFTTISPTHVPGQKRAAWERFLRGNYVAIGWLRGIDLTAKSVEEVEDLIRREGYENEPSALQSFRKFLSLDVGDYIAVNNAVHGLFGIGTVSSGYKFQPDRHDAGDGHFYGHYRDVNWTVTSYMPRSSLVTEGESGWPPFGTVGILYEEVPPYIARVLGIAPMPAGQEPVYIRPAFLENVIRCVEELRKDPQHQERAHESLVESFFVALGHLPVKQIKFRQGRVDLTLESDGIALAVVEVKRAWDLSFSTGLGAIEQGYRYAHGKGIRFVIVTNGDTYLLFDRLKGLSWQTNLLGEWVLTCLEQDDLAMLDRLKPERLAKPDIAELFQHLSEGFVKYK